MEGSAPPDWYDDPENPGIWRYWDGQAWTELRWEGPPQRPPLVPTRRSSRSRWSRAANVALKVIVGVVAAAFASALFAMFGYWFEPVETEPDDPSTRALEVVATPDGCLLNVATMAPGMHELAVFGERGRFRVRIKDPSGKVVYETVTQPEGEAVDSTSVSLSEVGTSQVECQGPAGKSDVVELQLTEAS
jgi:hypothetical protein